MRAGETSPIGLSCFPEVHENKQITFPQLSRLFSYSKKVKVLEGTCLPQGPSREMGDTRTHATVKSRSWEAFPAVGFSFLVRWTMVRWTLLVLLGLSSLTFAQNQNASLAGTVADPFEAVVPNARLTLQGPGGSTRTATSDGLGKYTFSGVPAGEYQLKVSAEGFTDYGVSQLRLTPGETLTHNIHLSISTVKAQIEVQADANEVSVEPSSNADALVLSGQDLETLSDNPEDLAQDLQALAGPAAGDEGGEVYVDGFSGGDMPPKSSIKEVRINQNPFSAEYDRPGRGRIEIITKPGSDRFRGNLRFDFGDSALNSRNPFVAQKADFRRKRWDGAFGGPLGKKTSFFVSLERGDTAESSAINALVLDPSLNVTPLQQTVPTPDARTHFSIRIDRQFGMNHTLTGRYIFERETQDNSGLDSFSLPSTAYNEVTRENILRLTETAILNPSTVNEARFQYRREYDGNTPLSSDPTIQVQQAFSSGGASQGTSNTTENQFEFTDMVSLTRAQHLIKVGGRIRYSGKGDFSTQNFNGQFTFASLDAYQITEQGLANGLTADQIAALGGGPIQFTMATGDPLTSVGQTDLGLFFQDDWKIRPQLTLSSGLRYEVQTNISDLRDFAPRVGIAWAPFGQNRKHPTVIRGGFGIFYTRVNQDFTLQALSLNGVRQQQFVVPDPTFYPSIPSVSQLAGSVAEQAIRQVAPNVDSPYILQSSVTLEQQLPRRSTLTLSYVNTRGNHRLRSRNINAPLPGTYDPNVPDSGVRPLPGGNVYQYESTASYRQNQLVARVNSRFSNRVSLFGFYVLGKAMDDAEGPGNYFPANQYDLADEWSPAGFDVRHRAVLGGSIRLPHDVSFNPFMLTNSGQPFNITIGRDINGDSLFTDRPAFATDLSRPSVVQTAYGVFDTDPLPGQTIIPRNYGRGPGQFTMNLRASKTFNIGHRGPGSSVSAQPFQGRGGPGGRERDRGGRGGAENTLYSFTFSVTARNLLNNVNLAQPIGNLSSSRFGESVAIRNGRGSSESANRMVYLQMRVSF